MSTECTAARIRWACRRGMLELDIILDDYLTSFYEKASAQEQALFRDLLSETDQDLFDWIFHKKEVTNPKHQKIIKKLLQL